MDIKKLDSKILELIKPASKAEILKKGIPSFKNAKSKTTMKKVARSRNQKGQKSY